MNMIEEYINFLITRYVKYALVFFNDDTDLLFIKDQLTTFFKIYTNYKYYNIVATIDNGEKYDYDGLIEEFKGIKVELLANLSSHELELTNKTYTYHRELIDKAYEVSLFVVKMVDNKELDTNLINQMLDRDSTMNKYIFKFRDELINLVKDTKSLTNRFLKEEETFYITNYIKMSRDNDLFYITLSPSIKVLESNYKKNLIDRIFEDPRLNKTIVEVLINKVCRNILIRTLNGEYVEKYMIRIDESLFSHGSFILEDLVNNPLFKKYVILLTDLNTYKSKENFFKDYECGCLQDMSHIPDVKEKLNQIDNLGVFTTVVVNDYKDKDYESIEKYEGDFNLYIRGEVR